MMGDAARALETERDYRKQVRKAYYMREEDFATLREYNDYLEEVEDIVFALLHEETRNAGRAKLDARRVASSEVTARNRAKLEADKRALSESISSQVRRRATAPATRPDPAPCSHSMPTPAPRGHTPTLSRALARRTRRSSARSFAAPRRGRHSAETLAPRNPSSPPQLFTVALRRSQRCSSPA